MIWMIYLYEKVQKKSLLINFPQKDLVQETCQHLFFSCPKFWESLVRGLLKNNRVYIKYNKYIFTKLFRMNRL